MRLLDLHLDRYGPFTDVRLAFPTDRPLAVVHGRNEAGKSSALSALADAFYGIEPRSRFNFVHDYTEMRVGATVENRAGERLVFRRRKGNRATLLDAGEGALADEALTPFLGRVDRALFLEAFGLDQARLRAGAEQLQTGAGSLGEALLAAAPGLGRLVDLRRTLAAAAGEVFSERRSAGKPFYRALDAWEAARKAVTADSLSADALARAEAALQKAREAVARIEADRLSRHEDRLRLERIVRARRRLLAIDGLLADLSVLSVSPAIDEAFERRAAAATARRETAAAAADLHGRERDAAAERLRTIVVDAAVLDEAAAIDRLAAHRARRAAAAGEMADTRGRIATAEAALGEAARQLGLADASALLARRPSAPAIARLRAAASAAEKDGVLVRTGEERLAAARGRLAALSAEADPQALADPRPIRARLETVHGLEAAERIADERRATLEIARRRLAEALTKAGLAGLDVAALRATRLPEAAVVERHEAAIRAAGQALAEARRRDDEAARRAAAAAVRLAELTSGESPPTVGALAEARRAREAAWDAVRALLFAETPTPAADRLAAARDLERRSEEADRVADRRIASADRLAALDAAEAAAAAAVSDRVAASEALAAAATECDRVRAAWAETAARHDLAGLQPADASLRIARWTDLVGLADRVEEAETMAVAAASGVDRLVQALEALLSDLGRRTPAGGWPAGLAEARAAVEDLDAAWTAARDRRRASTEAEAAVAEAERAVDAARAVAEAHRQTWGEAAAGVGLPATAGPEEAEAALGVWATVGEPAAALADGRARLERLDADCAAFDSEASRLRTLLGGPEDADPADLAARYAERLQAARAAETDRVHLTAAVAAAAEKAEAANAEAAAAAAELAALRTAAGLGEADDLAVRIAEARTARGLRERLAIERQALREETGRSEDAVRAEAESVDPDAAAARIEAIDGERTALDQDHVAAVEARTKAQADVDGLAARDGADRAAQAEQNALADLAETADLWRVRQAAARLAGRVVEEYRSRHQSPVLAEAGRLFGQLTLGRYPALASDYDEDGTPKLVAVRADGRRLDPTALSEGTADQLFLALRLATLTDHARRAEPMPFVGDDLFVTFDEERTAAGLDALASFGETAQAILFTHHEHVAAIAAERLGDRVAVLRLGG